MTKYFLPLLIVSFALLFSYCSPSKKSTSAMSDKAVGTSTYEKDISVLIQNHCTPCHIPPRGRMKAYDNYINVKSDINEMIRRIELNPGDIGFMPFKKTAKLSDSTINAFKQWKADGLIEH